MAVKPHPYRYKTIDSYHTNDNIGTWPKLLACTIFLLCRLPQKVQTSRGQLGHQYTKVLPIFQQWRQMQAKHHPLRPSEVFLKPTSNLFLHITWWMLLWNVYGLEATRYEMQIWFLFNFCKFSIPTWWMLLRMTCSLVMIKWKLSCCIQNYLSIDMYLFSFSMCNSDEMRLYMRL